MQVRLDIAVNTRKGLACGIIHCVKHYDVLPKTGGVLNFVAHQDSADAPPVDRQRLQLKVMHVLQNPFVEDSDYQLVLSDLMVETAREAYAVFKYFDEQLDMTYESFL